MKDNKYFFADSTYRFLVLGFVVFVLSFISCSHKMTPSTYKKNQIVFGSGGGFTNLINTYYLLENGRMYHKMSTDTAFTELKKQTKDSAKVYFEKTKALFDEVKEYREPGNRYYFIRFGKDSDSTQRSIVWGGSKETTPPQAKELYEALMNLVEEEEKEEEAKKD